jgi:hypothetical protein
MPMWVQAHSRSEPTADAGSGPIIIHRRRQALLGALVLVIASAWCAVPIRGLLVGAPEVVPGLGAIGAAGALAIGVALALLALSWVVRLEVVTIDRGSVGITERRLSGARAWHEPLKSYRGMRQRMERQPHRYGTRHWHVIELWHPEAEKTVELHRTKDARAAEQCTQAWARRLALPVCQPLDEPAARSKLDAGQDVAATTGSPRALPAA